MLITMACDGAAKGRKVGLFTPEHKQLQEPYEEINWILTPVRARASKTEGTVRTVTGGVADFWSLTDNELAGRGREYDLVLIDEGAFTKNGQMFDIWRKSIAPTMITRPGSRAVVFSTPNGLDPTNFFFMICNNPELKFREFYAPTSDTPYVPPYELERERRDNHPLVFRQEFLAEFIDWSGSSFLSIDSLLVDERPVPVPTFCDAVFATIDTAVKSGKEHDGLAVTYWASSQFVGHRLVVLDWDIINLEGSLLEAWLPCVFRNLEEFAKSCHARGGSLGAFIEDKVSGTILIQQAQRRGWPAHAIDSKLTDAGKSERAVSVSGYVYRGWVKISGPAYDKVTNYKGATRNHFLSQVTGFRVGAKDGEDDLLDTFTYGVAIALGGPEGY